MSGLDRVGPGRPFAEKRNRPFFLIPLAGFIGLFVVFGLGLTRNPELLPSALIDKPAPDFALPPLLPGHPGLARRDLVGKPVLVNFFASWCEPCREEAPVLAGLAASGVVTIYGIAYKDQPEAAQKFLGLIGNPYARVAIDAGGRTAIDFGLYGVPETYIVDAKGAIRYRLAGALTPENLQSDILPRLTALQHQQ
jgi:cytochrome c biogenesis protein CcmG/thiol:disulfide interchange protein DsbE